MPQARSGGSRRSGSSGGSRSGRSSSSRSASSRSTSSRKSSSGGARKSTARSSSARSSTSRARAGAKSTSRSRSTATRARSTRSAADARAEAVAQRLRKLNDRIIEAGKEAGEATLSSYERALKAIATTIEKGPGSSDIEWVSNLATAQAKFIRDLANSWTKRARKALR